MNRKKFFTSISLSALGLVIYKSFPMKIFFKKAEKNKKEIKVQLNPLAVNRKKIGDKNV